MDEVLKDIQHRAAQAMQDPYAYSGDFRAERANRALQEMARNCLYLLGAIAGLETAAKDKTYEAAKELCELQLEGSRGMLRRLFVEAGLTDAQINSLL